MVSLVFIWCILVSPLPVRSTSTNNNGTDNLTNYSSGINANWSADDSHLIERSELPHCNLNITGYCTIDGIGIVYVNQETTSSIKRDNWLGLLVATFAASASAVRGWQEYFSLCVGHPDGRQRYFSGTCLTSLITTLLFTSAFFIAIFGMVVLYFDVGNKGMIKIYVAGILRKIYSRVKAYMINLRYIFELYN
ncbi:hypothetical protein, no similarity [Maudiozyma barnettii]|uniref:Autophagy-related protein n=1 Tax=Maudiozyma barnettii TaxID=61262 RepID=A0A8H2VI25_9SACH|nr:hypothetical protein, no similarity [Kazachstania barnettii]CAB4255790.1 hypothetical protein, no similarity [Kazachstania barnettii]CAD1784351.1 hypothetical protein, no similarity [Kazachstania barnettii]